MFSLFKDKSGNTPLMKSVRKEPEYMEYNSGNDFYYPMNLKEGLPPNNVLNAPIWKGKKGSKMRNTIRSYPEDINAVNAQGDTVLHVAVKEMKFVHAMLLLNYHYNTINVNVQNNAGETPLYLTIANMKKSGLEITSHYIPFILALLRLGARMDIAANNGYFPLFFLLNRILNESDMFVPVLVAIINSGKLSMDVNSIQLVKQLEMSSMHPMTPGGRIVHLLSPYMRTMPVNTPTNPTPTNAMNHANTLNAASPTNAVNRANTLNAANRVNAVNAANVMNTMRPIGGRTTRRLKNKRMRTRK